MSVKLLHEHHLEFLSLKGCFTCSFQSTLLKMSHCWKSHVMALMLGLFQGKKVSSNVSEKGEDFLVVNFSILFCRQ